jgi:hypothetical protein
MRRTKKFKKWRRKREKTDPRNYRQCKLRYLSNTVSSFEGNTNCNGSISNRGLCEAHTCLVKSCTNNILIEREYYCYKYCEEHMCPYINLVRDDIDSWALICRKGWNCKIHVCNLSSCHNFKNRYRSFCEKKHKNYFAEVAVIFRQLFKQKDLTRYFVEQYLIKPSR